MKLRIIKGSVLLFFVIHSSMILHAQKMEINNPQDYFFINLAPAVGNSLELGYEINQNAKRSLDISAGYVFNSSLEGSILYDYTYSSILQSGMFLKLGARKNFRQGFGRFAPYMGLSIINAVAIEKGEYQPSYPPFVGEPIPAQKNSYNFAMGGYLGLTSPSDRKFGYEIGIQAGVPIVFSMLNERGYFPGLGIPIQGIYLNGILKVKYALEN